MSITQINLIELITYWAVTGLVGLCFGSLANVLLWRIPRIILGEASSGQSDLIKDSCCNVCHTPLRWYHNIPLFSWIALKGKCGFCSAPISARYPLVELAGMALALVMAYFFGFTFKAVALFAFVYLSAVAMVIDIEHRLLPWALSGALAVSSLLLYAAQLDYTQLFSLSSYAPLGNALIMALVIGGLFEAMMRISAFVLKKEAMGGGDPPYVAALCLWVGSLNLASDLILIACVFSLLLALFFRSKEVPFGPGLTFGAYWVVFFPQFTLHATLFAN